MLRHRAAGPLRVREARPKRSIAHGDVAMKRAAPCPVGVRCPVHRLCLASCVGLLVACASAHEVDDASHASDAGVDAPTPDAAHVDSGCPALDELLAFQEARDRATCERGVSCLSEEGSDVYGFVVAQDCTDHGDHSEYLCSQLASGILVFDRDAARSCLDALALRATTPCYDRLGFGEPWLFDRGFFFTPPSICAEALRPTLPDGSPVDCTRAPCPGGYPCVAGASCGGSCGHVAEGEPCNRLVRCGTGLLCDEASARCRPGCSYDSDCGTDSYCIGGACVTPVLPGVGEPCFEAASERRVCSAGTFCDPATDTCERTRAFGEACTPSWPDSCAYGACLEGRCDVREPCFPNPVSTDWDSCVPELPWCGTDGLCTVSTSSVMCYDSLRYYGFDGCPSGMQCDPYPLVGTSEGTCRVPAAIGEPCSETVPCVYGSRCGRDGCAPLVPFGGPCDFDYVCAFGECESGRCVDPWPSPDRRALGESCDSSSRCASGACRDGFCAWVASGEACTEPSECPNADCVDGRCAPYVWVADDARCDEHDRLCSAPTVCLPTGEDDEAGAPIQVCRAPCR